MSLVKAFSNLTITRSYVSLRSLHPKKFTSILDNVPSRPRNPWQIYIRENIQQYKNESGKSNLATAAKQLSVKWNSLSEVEKQPYVVTYQNESADHVAKYEEALKNASPKQFKMENALRRKYNLSILKDPKQPKRPKNSFLFYIEHLKDINDPIYVDNIPRERVSIAAKKYKLLDDSQKKEFNEKAEAARKQYQKDIEAYNKTAGEVKLSDTSKLSGPL